MGSARCGDAALPERRMAMFANNGPAIEVAAETDSQLLVLAGEPIDEPVVSWGPFVMNTREQILQAREDCAMGRMGVLEDRG